MGVCVLRAAIPLAEVVFERSVAFQCEARRFLLDDDDDGQRKIRPDRRGWCVKCLSLLWGSNLWKTFGVPGGKKRVCVSCPGGRAEPTTRGSTRFLPERINYASEEVRKKKRFRERGKRKSDPASNGIWPRLNPSDPGLCDLLEQWNHSSETTSWFFFSIPRVLTSDVSDFFPK